jgi:hypothetical protein
MGAGIRLKTNEDKNMTMHLIQSELKAPKGNYNSFGKYKYRSCEDIVEAAKPVLAKYECHISMTDDVVMVGDRVYIKATASIYKNGVVLATSTAFAREPEEKKGMDASQITGTASSYARKYALNGLLAIDDTKDADTDEHKVMTSQPEKKVLPTDPHITHRIHSSESIDDLRDVWKSLTLEQRDAHSAVFTEVRERLE